MSKTIADGLDLKGVKTDADTAQSTASTALANAATAQTTANNAQSTANTANTTANNAIPLTQKGAANGVATLDGTAHIPAGQIPAGSGGTLNDAYNYGGSGAGAVITVVNAHPVHLDKGSNDATNAFETSVTAGSGAGIAISMGGSTTGAGLTVTMALGATGAAVNVVDSGANTLGITATLITASSSVEISATSGDVSFAAHGGTGLPFNDAVQVNLAAFFNTHATSIVGAINYLSTVSTTVTTLAPLTGTAATAGANSTAVGVAAVAGTNAVAVGNAATANASSVVIGYSATDSGGNNIILGWTSAPSSQFGAGANQFVAGSHNLPTNDVFFGAGATDVSPSAYTIHGTSGSGTNNTGAGLNLAAGQGTGTAASGDVAVQYAPAGLTGSTLNSLVTGWKFDNLGNAVLNASGVALVTGTNTGFTFLPSMAGTPTGTPSSFTGAVGVVIDTSGSKLWAYIGGTWKSTTLA